MKTRKNGNDVAEKPNYDLIGIGLYTPSEASALTGVKAARIRRWLTGYASKAETYPALWQSQVQLDAHTLALGFRDLTEVRIVARLIELGLSTHKVRKAIEFARQEFGLERPLSTRAFRTDGKHILLAIMEKGEDRFVDVHKKQYSFGQILEPSFKGLEFDQNGIPARWSLGNGIVLDPQFSFGQPIDQESKIPVAVLAAAFEAEGTAEHVARLYDLPVKSVNRVLQHVREADDRLKAA